MPVSATCRFLPPTSAFSVSPLEKTDAQILLARVGITPKVASNHSIINGRCIGAEATVHIQMSNYRYVPAVRSEQYFILAKHGGRN